MKIFIVSLFVLVFLVIIIFFSRLTITAHYVHNNQKDHLTVRIVALFGIVSKTWSIPGELKAEKAVEKQIKERGQSWFKKMKADAKMVKDFLHLLNESKHTLRKFLKKIIVHELSWVSMIGAGDAALTGKLIGAAWSIKGIVQMLVYQFLTIRCRPCLDVSGFYNHKVTSTEFHCIFSIRVGDAILTAVQILRYWKTGNSKKPSSLFIETNKTVYQEE